MEDMDLQAIKAIWDDLTPWQKRRIRLYALWMYARMYARTGINKLLTAARQRFFPKRGATDDTQKP